MEVLEIVSTRIATYKSSKIQLKVQFKLKKNTNKHKFGIWVLLHTESLTKGKGAKEN